MIQEISPHHFNNHFLQGRAIEKNDYVLIYRDNELLLKTKGDDFEIPKKQDFPEFPGNTEYIFLFTLDDTACFMAGYELFADRPGFVFRDISFFRTARQPEVAWISIAGFHLFNWYTQNRYCGKCGSRTHHRSDERALVCPDCNTVVYPKISPAVIVAIVSGNKILLARNSHFSGSWYSLIAGYVDIGESLEEAVAREVKEEVGLDVFNIRYYKSQPWPLSGSVMTGFIAEADEKQEVVIDSREIADAAWFLRGRLPGHSLNLSIAGEMIEKFESGEI